MMMVMIMRTMMMVIIVAAAWVIWLRIIRLLSRIIGWLDCRVIAGTSVVVYISILISLIGALIARIIIIAHFGLTCCLF
jgi:hypothetical protein